MLNLAGYTFTFLIFISVPFSCHSVITLIAVFCIISGYNRKKIVLCGTFTTIFLYEVPLVDMPTVIIYSKALSHELSNVNSL